MSDVSNLKINEFSNVEHPTSRVTKIGNKNSKVKASKLIYIKRQILELSKSRTVQNIEWANNFKIFQFLELNCDCKLQIF